MASAPKRYRPLPGRSRKWFALALNQRYRLWLADDHVMQVCQTGYNESCKRFYFKDIQACATSRTSAGQRMAYTWGALLSIVAIFFVVALLLGGSIVGDVIWGTFAIAFAIGFAINYSLGPTCTCTLYTAAHAEDLPGLRRLKAARKTIGLLVTQIETVQGEVNESVLDQAEAAQARAEVIKPAASAMDVAVGRMRPKDEAPALRRESGRAHMLLWGLTLIMALSAVIDMFFQHAAKNMMDMMLVLTLVGVNIWALVRQRGSDVPSYLKTLTIVNLGICVAVFWSAQMLHGMRMAAYPEKYEGVYLAGPALTTEYDDPISLTFYAVQAVVFAVMALLGALAMVRWRRAAHTPQGIATAPLDAARVAENADPTKMPKPDEASETSADEEEKEEEAWHV